MTLSSRLAILQRRLGQFPCECRRWSPPIIEVEGDQEPAESEMLPAACPKCGRVVVVRAVLMCLPPEEGG